MAEEEEAKVVIDSLPDTVETDKLIAATPSCCFEEFWDIIGIVKDSKIVSSTRYIRIHHAHAEAARCKDPYADVCEVNILIKLYDTLKSKVSIENPAQADVFLAAYNTSSAARMAKGPSIKKYLDAILRRAFEPMMVPLTEEPLVGRLASDPYSVIASSASELSYCDFWRVVGSNLDSRVVPLWGCNLRRIISATTTTTTARNVTKFSRDLNIMVKVKGFWKGKVNITNSVMANDFIQAIRSTDLSNTERGRHICIELTAIFHKAFPPGQEVHLQDPSMIRDAEPLAPPPPLPLAASSSSSSTDAAKPTPTPVSLFIDHLIELGERAPYAIMFERRGEHTSHASFCVVPNKHPQGVVRLRFSAPSGVEDFINEYVRTGKADDRVVAMLYDESDAVFGHPTYRSKRQSASASASSAVAASSASSSSSSAIVPSGPMDRSPLALTTGGLVRRPSLDVLPPKVTFSQTKIFREQGAVVCEEGAHVLADNAEVHADNCIVTGNNAAIYGSHCLVAGNNATVYGSYNRVSGANCTLLGANNERIHNFEAHGGGPIGPLPSLSSGLMVASKPYRPLSSGFSRLGPDRPSSSLALPLLIPKPAPLSISLAAAPASLASDVLPRRREGQSDDAFAHDLDRFIDDFAKPRPKPRPPSPLTFDASSASAAAASSAAASHPPPPIAKAKAKAKPKAKAKAKPKAKTISGTAKEMQDMTDAILGGAMRASSSSSSSSAAPVPSTLKRAVVVIDSDAEVDAEKAEAKAKVKRTTKVVLESECVYCQDARPRVVLVPCGHFCLCETCGKRDGGLDATCPLCMAPISLGNVCNPLLHEPSCTCDECHGQIQKAFDEAVLLAQEFKALQRK